MGSAGIDRLLVEPPRSRGWQRTLAGVATESELHAATDELASIWNYNASDHRFYDEFLLSRGIDRRRTTLSGEQELHLREEFSHLIASKTRITLDFIQAALKIDPAHILTRSRDFTQDLKHLVFGVAIQSTNDEIAVLSLVYLSEETSETIELENEYILARHLRIVFHRYLHGERDPLETPRLKPQVTPPTGAFDLLLWLTDHANSDIVTEIGKLDAATREKLAGAASHFASILPRREFGRYLCARAAMYLSLHEPNEDAWMKNKELLEPYASRHLAEFVALLGNNLVVTAIKSLPDKLDGAFDDYAASLIDHLRGQKAVDQILLDAKRLQTAGKLTSIAYEFATSRQRPNESKHLAKNLMNLLRKDNDGRVSSWIVRNPEVLEVLKSHSIQPRTGVRLATAAACEGSFSVSALCQWVLKEENEDSKLTLGIVEELSTQPRYSNEVSVALQRLLGSGGTDIPNLLRSKRLRHAIVGNLIHIAPFLSGQRLNQVLAALRPIPAQISSPLIRSVLASEHSEWAVEHLIPILLEDDPASSQALIQGGNTVLTSRLLSKLASAWSRNVTELTNYEQDWRSARNQFKKAISDRALASLAATKSLSMPEISSRLERLSDEISTWLSQDSPPYKSVSGKRWKIQTDFPMDIDPKRISDPNDFVSLIALRPDLISQFKESSTSRFPSVESALDVVIREYVVAAKAWQKGQSDLVQLRDTVGMDLAIRLREMLEDLEVSLTPYFLFRSALDSAGVKAVTMSLANAIEESSLSSRIHKVHRSAEQAGKLRTFSLGVQVGTDVVGGIVVMKSGDPNDRD